MVAIGNLLVHGRFGYSDRLSSIKRFKKASKNWSYNNIQKTLTENPLMIHYEWREKMCL